MVNSKNTTPRQNLYGLVLSTTFDGKLTVINLASLHDIPIPISQGGDTPYTKARRFLSTCERGHLGLRSIARVIIL